MTEPRPFRVFTQKDIDRIPHLAAMPAEARLEMKAVAAVLPFRVNEYVLDSLIDWSAVPHDPIFQLTFPQRGMLAPEDYAEVEALVARGAHAAALEPVVRRIQRSLNPHPAGQLDLNVPYVNGRPVPGLQHKYRETVLFFPSQGQTCHAYCTYCFRWAQFVGVDELRFAHREATLLRDYVAAHPEVTSVLVTGGDPMVMRASVLRRIVEPLLDVEHVASIRIGTKSVAYWPQRFVSDADADDVLRLFEEVGKRGKSLALMAHYSHPRELSTPVAEAAVRRIVSSGATVRCQAPLIRHVNDDPETWATLWRHQVRLGAVPYYMFVERDTGARHHFEVPLARALRIFTEAYRGVSGLARTVRGPTMSCTPGKVHVAGVAELAGERVFVLRMIQGRDPTWANRVFFAEHDAEACWMDQLRPAFGEREFFFEPTLREARAHALRRALPVVGPAPDAEAAE